MTLAQCSLMSCQISFYPLGEEEVNDLVHLVIQLIDQSGLQYESNAMATLVFGEPSRIFRLLEEIHASMAERGTRFVMPVTLSNVCGL